MTDWLLGLVPTYGLWLILLSTYLSNLALPIPSSMLLLAAGGFVASGDLSLAGSAGAALVATCAGSQTTYALGRKGGQGLAERLGKRAAPLAKATAMLEKRGGVAVFLSRWLVSALAPYMGFASGMARLDWKRFTLWALAGDVIWVALYLGLGRAFTGDLAAASGLALKLLGFLAAGALALGLGWWLVAALRSEGAKEI